MNPAQIKSLAVFAVFAVIGFGPVSPGCLIGMYVVAMRPRWFVRLITDMYADLPEPLPDGLAKTAEQIKQARIKCFLCLLGLFIIDIAPVPVTPVIAFGVILLRPRQFYRVVSDIYADIR